MPRRPIGPAALRLTLSPRFSEGEARELRAAAAAAGRPVCTWLREVALAALPALPEHAPLPAPAGARASRSDAA